ncbi:MAG: hypothetical protein EXR17_02420 [Flavobacteriaceae bacterium]|nr:hypothetical protein [Flavobacteriaceae bacterium]
MLEYHLWLSVSMRLFFFWAICLGFSSLLAYGIIFPFLKMRGVGKVLSHKEAANFIGMHFNDVQDKLLNLLQMEEMAEHSDANNMLLAGIEQKTQSLKVFPFLMALDWKKHRKWTLRFSILLLFLLAIVFSQSSGILLGAKRIFNYQKEYIQEAPFQLFIDESRLIVDQDTRFVLDIKASGVMVPDFVDIVVNNQSIRARKLDADHFQYVFESVHDNIFFRLESMGFTLGGYAITVTKKPRWQSLSVKAYFPSYTGFADAEMPNPETLLVPEGTRLVWELRGLNVSAWQLKNSSNKGKTVIAKEGGTTQIEYIARNNERLRFSMKGPAGFSVDTFSSNLVVQADGYPSIRVDALPDSVRLGTWYFMGLANDDYGLKEVLFLSRIKHIGLRSKDSAWSKKILFDGLGLDIPVMHAIDLLSMGLQSGEELEYQFVLRDNDAIHGGKVFRTPIRSLEVISEKEVMRQLEKQEANILKGMGNSAKALKELQKEAAKLQETMQRQTMDWDGENKVKNWLNEQQKLAETLKQIDKKQTQINNQKKNFSPISEELEKKKDALNERIKQLTNPEMQKLIDEINALLEQKASKEQLKEKMQKLSQVGQETAKELDKLMEQLKELELEEAMVNQLEKIQEWVDKEENLSVQTDKEKGKESSEDIKQKQDKQNEALFDIEKGIQDIRKKNQELEKPMDLKMGEAERKEAGNESQKASQELQNNRKPAASDKMRKSAQKMKEAMQAMQENFEQEQKKRLAEDYQTLRALLENLIEASNRQEAIFIEMRKVNPENPKLVALNKEQMRLKESLLFIEDSLMALSKRQPMISNFVSKEMGRVNTQMGMALDEMKVRGIASAAMHEQYVMTGLNNLSEMLMESLQNMQQKMSSQQKQDGKKSCNNPNNAGSGKTGKPKPSDKLSDAQKELGEQLQKMQDQKRAKPSQSGKSQPGGKTEKTGESGEPTQRELSEGLAKMALMQEALRRQVEQLRKQLGQEGKQGMSNSLMEIEKLMNQQEKDIVNGRLNQQSMERQKQIMTRLLENEKADRKQDQEDRRESNRAEVNSPEIPQEMADVLRTKIREREQLRAVQPMFKPYYKQSVQKYLQIYSR